jgi:hypothetical protein
LTSAQADLWTLQGDSPFSVTWAIGTSKFATDIAAAVATFPPGTNTPNGLGEGIFQSYESAFSIAAVLGPGTYWFTLSNGITVANSTDMFWAVSNGASQAFVSVQPTVPEPSESFQLFGNQNVSTPEPASVKLLGSVLLGFGGFRLSRWRRKATLALNPATSFSSLIG